MLESILPFFSFPQLALAINLLNLDYDLGLALNIGEFAGGILLTLIFFLACSGLAIYKKNTQAMFIIGILVMCFSIAVAWLSIFVLILVVFLMALGIADKLTGILGGRLS